ncbi:MAG: DUF418 domain-containing protein [Sphingomonadales bacterium]|nr:MAG: DUF418 domain-containing protein [Sphingomonadales bacterium]
MTAQAMAVTGTDRMPELDIIRGFALFGVLWMNLFEHADLAMAPDILDKLWLAPVDRVVGPLSSWLMQGKAQALFSMLFGLGFALFLDRAQARGADGTRLYLRRLSFLLILGVAHALLLWMGDILNAYAAMGFLLILTRRWPNWALLVAGLALTLLTTVALRLYADMTVPQGQAPWWVAIQDAGTARRYAVFMGHDYLAYVRELWIGSTAELYLMPIGPAYLGWILGRFLLGSWIFRQGWMQNTQLYAAGFRKWAPILLVSGLLIAGIGPLLYNLGIKVPSPWNYGMNLLGRTSQLLLPLGYAATLVVLWHKGRMKRLLSGLGAAGQMALTNYLTQSLLFFFVFYGFGLGLLPYAGATFSLLLALGFYALQIAFSIWWLKRYRFGPAEWVWRSFTYGERQPFKL